MKTILAGFLIIFSSFSLSAQSKITKEEYAVYSKVFESIYEKRKVPSAFQIVILENTVKKTSLSGTPERRLIGFDPSSKLLGDQFYREASRQKTEEILKSYNENNSASSVIKKRLKTQYNYAVISQYELNKLLIAGKRLYDEMPEKPVDEPHSPIVSWKPFLSSYHTDGCYSLSRVGFSKDNKLALVLVSWTDGISGKDSFYALEKVNGRWMTAKFFGAISSWII